MAVEAVTKVDKTGRVYLPRPFRKIAGIPSNTVLNIEAHKGKIILRKRVTKVAESSKGIFKLKARIEDVDQEIHRLSAEEIQGELNEIRGR